MNVEIQLKGRKYFLFNVLSVAITQQIGSG